MLSVKAYLYRRFDSKRQLQENLAKILQTLSNTKLCHNRDKTQHVLWRVMNIDLPDSLKFVIVHCGTNNVGKDGSIDIVNALFLIATHIQKRKPGVKIFVSGLLPREQFPSKTHNIIDLINKEPDLLCRTKIL